MMITTKFMGPTNNRGARVKATSASGKSKTVRWEHCVDVDSNHQAVAEVLASQMVADGASAPDRWIRRWNKDGSCVHVGVYTSELKR